jgi:hypothetical protein
MNSHDEYSTWDGGTPTPYKFENPGDSFTGKFVEIRQISTDKGQFELVIFEDDEGQIVSHSGAALKRVFREFPSHQGIRVRITYLNDIKLKTQASPMKNFRVEVHGEDQEKVENHKKQPFDVV